MGKPINLISSIRAVLNSANEGDYILGTSDEWFLINVISGRLSVKEPGATQRLVQILNDHRSKTE